MTLLPADVLGSDPDRGQFEVRAGSAAAGEFAGQVPPSSLLLGAMLSGFMWWGIIAGMRWIWLAI